MTTLEALHRWLTEHADWLHGEVTTDKLLMDSPEEWDFNLSSGDEGWSCAVLIGEGPRTFVDATAEDDHRAVCEAVKLALLKVAATDWATIEPQTVPHGLRLDAHEYLRVRT